MVTYAILSWNTPLHSSINGISTTTLSAVTSPSCGLIGKHVSVQGPSINNFSGIDISQSLDQEWPSLSAHFLLSRHENIDCGNRKYNQKPQWDDSRILRTCRNTIQTKTSILHRQLVQDSCQRVRVLSQISLWFSQFGFKFLNII